MRVYTRTSPVVLFWRMVEKLPGENACWLWTGATDRDGYGLFSITLDVRKQKRIRAHRFAWQEQHGPTRDGTLFMHACDTPRCVRPSHVRPATQLENVRDAVRKGHHDTKLTAALVVEIRDRKNRGERTIDLAREYGVSACYVSNIAAGRKRAA